MRPDLATPLSARELLAAFRNLCFKYHDTMPLFVFFICLCELALCCGILEKVMLVRQQGSTQRYQ